MKIDLWGWFIIDMDKVSFVWYVDREEEYKYWITFHMWDWTAKYYKSDKERAEAFAKIKKEWKNIL